MSLTSIIFALFSIIAVVIYFITSKRFKWIILLISSIFFLFYDNFSLYTIMQALVVLLSSYIFGLLIDKYKNTKSSNLFFLLGVGIILCLLLYLKYTNLFLTTLNHFCNLFNINYKFNLVYRNSLVGISYYSLIMISYLVDIKRGTCKAQKNIFKCMLFMSYFPILNSGPFIRYNDIKNDLYEGHKFNYHSLCSGLLRICFGFVKIMVISQRFAGIVDTIYGNLSSYSGIYIFIAVLLFTLQLYSNFSGSIDIIMGISEIIGIKLPENFTSPLLSKTITEFWRNWHITLGAWLKDYIFYPLLKSNFMQSLNVRCKKIFGKKIGKKIPLYLSMLIMWILIGIWHGGAYTFIIGTGLLQFIYIFLEDILQPVALKINNKLKINTNSFIYRLYQNIRTYLLFSFSMIFFRATSVSNAIQIIKSIFKNHITTGNIIFDLTSKGGVLEFLVFIIAILLVFIIEVLEKKENVREKILKQNIFIRWFIIYVILFLIIIFGCYGPGYDPATFIYRQF